MWLIVAKRINDRHFVRVMLNDIKICAIRRNEEYHLMKLGVNDMSNWIVGIDLNINLCR